METIKHFKELKVWQKGIEIVKDTKMNFINEKWITRQKCCLLL